MRLRRALRSASFLLLLTPAVLLCQSTVPPAEQAAILPAPAKPAATDMDHASDAAKGTVASSHVLFFYTAPRSTIELEVHTVPPSSQERLDHLRDAFLSVGCSGDRMEEQPVAGKHGETGTNLICIWPASTRDAAPGAAPSAPPDRGTIVIAAHYEHEGPGQGALADWSGAALLPFLYEAIQGQMRANEFVFLESWRSQGAATWLRSLSKERRQHIRAMIDVDALGLGATRYFTPFSFMETPPPGAAHLQTELLWAAIDDGLDQPPQQTSPRRWLAQDNTEPFRSKMIPTIVIHSVAPASDHLPGSAGDIASAVDGNAYFQSYRLLCTYLTSLDRIANKLDRDDPVWTMPHDQQLPAVELNPRVTFRRLGGLSSYYKN